MLLDVIVEDSNGSLQESTHSNVKPKDSDVCTENLTNTTETVKEEKVKKPTGTLLHCVSDWNTYTVELLTNRNYLIVHRQWHSYSGSIGPSFLHLSFTCKQITFFYVKYLSFEDIILRVILLNELLPCVYASGMIF